MNRSALVESVYRAHADAVRAKLRRLGYESDDVDDLCQAVFEMALRPDSSFAKVKEGAARRWLLDTARKLAANERRLLRHHYEVRDGAAVDGAIAEPEDPEGQIALHAMVHKATDALDGADRDMVILYHLEGATVRELARMLRAKRSTVFVRVKSATSRLCDAINAFADTDADVDTERTAA